MSEHSITFKMKPPTRAQRLWYRRLGLRPPEASGSTYGRRGDWARLVPYRFRRFHHAYATANGFFWLPCPLCDKPFGGHEGGDDIPDPTRAPSGGVVICSRCTIARNREA